MSGFISSFLKKRHSPAVRIEEEASLMNFGLARVIKYEELKKATNNFNTVLGNGGYGRVYLGKLQDGQMVAVKVLLDHNPKRLEQFFNEVTALSRLRHKNLVSLYGCTSPRSQELLLVYEYVPNGTVADHLHGKRTTLTLAMRVQIAMETAEALAYLHSLEPPLIHRDVKTSNILLDYEFHVKVADLGICRLLPWDSTHVSTVPQGTMGYRDPEYERYFRLTDKTDVYSFGVVLMELISGQQAVDVNRAPEDVYLNIMALDKILNKKLDTFVDPELGYHSNNGVRRIIDSVAELASNCLQPEGDMRPSMLHVLTVLKGIQNEKHQMPPQDGRQEEVHVKGIQHEKQQKDTNSFDPQQELHDESLNEVYRDAKQVLEKDTSQRENNSQCKDEKERGGELHPEKSKAARDLSNDSSNEVPGREPGAENGYTEPESMMENDTENTKWHTEDALQKSELDASAATDILKRDTSMSETGYQCEDKKKSDKESGSESKAAMELRTNLTDDVFDSEQGAKNGVFDAGFLMKDNEINRGHIIQDGIYNPECEKELEKYFRRKDGSVDENKWQDDGRESGVTSGKKTNDKQISFTDNRRRIGNFRHERHAEGMNRIDKILKEIDINHRYHIDRHSGEASSINHANNMHHRKSMMKDNLTKNLYQKSKQQDSNQRIKSTGKSSKFSSQNENQRDLRSQHKKQSIGDVEKRACNSSKLHSYADRNRSENLHSKKVDSAVGDDLSKSLPNPIITRSRSRHCLGCRSREEESAQREQLSHEKSRVSAASTKDHGSTSEIRKRNSVYQHSEKFQYSVGENRSKNSPSSQAIKDPSRCIREKTFHSWGFFYVMRCKSNGGSTRKESLSQGSLHVSASSRVDHSGASRAWKRDSKHGYSEEADTTTSHILQDRSWCRLRQGNSTQRESLSHEKSRPSVASTAGHCSTPRFGNREPQYRHSEKADISVCNNRSKHSSSSPVKYQSGLKQGNSTQREPLSREKFCASVASTVDNCSTPGVGKRDPQNQHLEKVDFSFCDNQSKKSSISFVKQYQRGSRSKEGNSTSSSQAVDLKNCRAWGSEARISPIKLIEVKTHVCEEGTH